VTAPRRGGRFALAVVAAWLAGGVLAGPAGMWGGLGVTAVLLGAVVVVRDPAVARGWLTPGVGPALLGVAAGVATAAAAHFLYPIAAGTLAWIARDTAALYAAFAAVPAVAAAPALLVIVLGEELVWRGLVLDVLGQRLRPVGTVLAGAALYAVGLAPTGSPVLVTAAFCCGLCWCALRAVTGGLVAPVLAHLVWDAVVLFGRAAG
jgi:membrane protease YdiL (CAAX protease family)